MTSGGFSRLALLGTLLTLVVITFGAYVRLSHAGLSCPDWPGCYGRIGVPQDSAAIASANAAFPKRPVEVGRAWLEMVHRYLAGGLGLLIVAMAIVAWKRRHVPGQQLALPLLLLVLVVAQALLGMWTVTLLLKPLVVTAHLLGGITVALLLWWLALRHGGYFGGFERPLINTAGSRYTPWVLLGVLLVYLQIFLGGWTSTNYAALACVDFPTCQGELIPPLALREAFTLWRGLGVDYEGGLLATDARVTIHWAHRAGALVVLIYLGVLVNALMSKGHDARVRRAGTAVLLVLLAQLGLGISSVMLSLPLPVAVAHSGVAVLLLLSLLTVYHLLRPARVAV